MAASQLPSVLIVEDEAIIALDVRRQLEAAGFPVVGIESDAAKVVETVARLRPGLVLMDVQLHGAADGVTLAEDVYLCEQVPVVFLSAFSDDALLERAGRAGAFGYLVKPFAPATLLSTLRLAAMKHAEVAGQRREVRWMRASLRAVPHPFVVLDEAGALVFANPAAEKLVGATRLDLAAAPPPWLGLLGRAAEDVVLLPLAAGPDRVVRATRANRAAGDSEVLVWRLDAVAAGRAPIT